MLKSEQTWRGVFSTVDGTGALSAATVGPVATLYVDGVATADIVTVAGANPYTFQVTLPVLTAGQSVQLRVAATVSGLAIDKFIAGDMADTEYVSGVATAVWNVLVSALTTVGSIGKFLIDYLTGIKARTDLLGTTTVAAVSPVLATGDVEITRGDCYYHADNRRLTWTVETWNIAESSTVVVIISRAAALTATRLSATSVGLELTSAQSIALPEGEWEFWIQEIKATEEERLTLLNGTWTTNARPYPVAE